MWSDELSVQCANRCVCVCVSVGTVDNSCWPFFEAACHFEEFEVVKPAVFVSRRPVAIEGGDCGNLYVSDRDMAGCVSTRRLARGRKRREKQEVIPATFIHQLEEPCRPCLHSFEFPLTSASGTIPWMSALLM